MSFKDFQYAFVNGMSLADQREAYDKLVIPESKTDSRGGLSKAAAVDYEKPHPPLLMMAGSEDHITPAHLNKRNFERYKKNGSVLEYKEYAGRNHFVLGLPTWQENANYILRWLRNL